MDTLNLIGFIILSLAYAAYHTVVYHGGTGIWVFIGSQVAFFAILVSQEQTIKNLRKQLDECKRS